MDLATTPSVTASPRHAPAVDSVWGRDGFGFDDLLDIVNPLQHLPVVSQVYRRVTGDEIGMLPQIAGGLLFGGPIGGAVAIVGAGIEAGTGRSAASHALAALQGDAAAPATTASPQLVARAYQPTGMAIPAPTPHAQGPMRAAAASVAPSPADWLPPVSGASARVLAELERAANTAG
jgi:hypothetical protein